MPEGFTKPEGEVYHVEASGGAFRLSPEACEVMPDVGIVALNGDGKVFAVNNHP